MDFKLTSKYQPTGDQPEAIRQLTDGVLRGDRAQVLLGVTGSGKTFTIANVIQNVARPTLILSHNKTLAAQLYEEMRGFFPENAVEYYVSYYDYYQPEAYLPHTDTYIEKDLAINEEIDRLRLAAVSSLLSGRRDVIVVSSVSCIYGMGSPNALSENVIDLRQGQHIDRNILLRKLVQSLYVRNDLALERGNFRVKGDTVDIYVAYAEKILRVTFWDDEIDQLEELDPVTLLPMGRYADYRLYPANPFTLTIHYVYAANGAAAAADYTATLAPGTAYAVASPAIDGYYVTDDVVYGTMPTRDVELTVYYVALAPAVPATVPVATPDVITIDDYGTPLGLGNVSINAGECIE